MKARIFNAVPLLILIATYTSVSAQTNNNVTIRPLTVHRLTGNAKFYFKPDDPTTLIDQTSGVTSPTPEDTYRVDTGYNDLLYIFSISPNNRTQTEDAEIPFIILSGDTEDPSAPTELLKNYSKSFCVKASDKLIIDNLYGKISVNTWNKNEIKVDVQVKVAAKDEADAKRLLNKVTINNDKKGSNISFKTNIAKESVWSLLSGSNKNIYRRIEINYNIYMPTRNALDISNQWGIIELPDFDGKVVIKCSYTNLFAQSLSNTAEIHINNGDAKIAKLKMSDLNISYGNLSVGSADKLIAVVNFSSAKIGKINTSGVINMQYGTGLQIDDLDKNIQKLSVNSSFSNVKLGLSEAQNANINVTVRNGSFSYNNPSINIAAKNNADSAATNGQWQPEQSYKGQIGKGSATKVININSSYGSVKVN